MVIPSAFKTEGSAPTYIRSHVAAGTKVHADEANSWNDMHSHYVVKRINHQLFYATALPARTVQKASSLVCAGSRRAPAPHRGRLPGPLLHIGVDAGTGQIVAAALTTKNIDDGADPRWDWDHCTRRTDPCNTADEAGLLGGCPRSPVCSTLRPGSTWTSTSTWISTSTHRGCTSTRFFIVLDAATGAAALAEVAKPVLGFKNGRQTFARPAAWLCPR